MGAGGILGCFGQCAVKFQRAFVVVFKLEEDKTVFLPDRHRNKALLRVIQCGCRPEGVVQRIAENRVDVHTVEEGQPVPVRHTGHADLVCLTIQTFIRQNRVQYIAAGVQRGIINLNRILHFLAVGLALGFRYDRL